jgi:hypothetical protein
LGITRNLIDHLHTYYTYLTTTGKGEKWALYHASPFLLQLKSRYQSFIGSAISKMYEGILSFDDLFPLM